MTRDEKATVTLWPRCLTSYFNQIVILFGGNTNWIVRPAGQGTSSL
jgi:hypothetical protein